MLRTSSTGRAADGHADFFTVLLLHADRVLGRLVPADAAARWQREPAGRRARARLPLTSRAEPAAAQLEPRRGSRRVAARPRRVRPRARDWVEASLARQVEHFTPAGMYRDPERPDGLRPLRPALGARPGRGGVRRRAGARCARWSSAAPGRRCSCSRLTASCPCGGRSAHHQWNEAEQAVTFETFARFCARPATAGRGRRRSSAPRASPLQSIARWVRPSGELWIVKNRVDPQRRHGYESYSFHSQYNLLTAAMLALAWLRADETIAEARLPGRGRRLRRSRCSRRSTRRSSRPAATLRRDRHGRRPALQPDRHPARAPSRRAARDAVRRRDARAADYPVPAKPSRPWRSDRRGMDGAGSWHALAAHGAADLDATGVRDRASRTASTGRGRTDLPRPPARRSDGGARDGHRGRQRALRSARASTGVVRGARRAPDRAVPGRATVSPKRGDRRRNGRATVVERGGGTLSVSAAARPSCPAGRGSRAATASWTRSSWRAARSGARCRLRAAP